MIATGTVLRHRYELQALLGRGGRASVFKARDRYRASLHFEDCHVAVKVADPERGSSDLQLAWGREFYNAQRLAHPNVINVYEIDYWGDTCFYTMELLDGERLSDVIGNVGGQLQRGHALALIRDIGAAIAHAHSRGVVHGDIKPQNIMITRQGSVRVIDFGGTRMLPGQPWISHFTPGAHSRWATAAYASCEQLSGSSAEVHDDLYALACVAYCLLAGRHPFDQASAQEARERRLRPKRPRGLRGDAWQALCEGLAWNREARGISVAAWLARLPLAEAAPSLPSPLELTPDNRSWLQRLKTSL